MLGKSLHRYNWMALILLTAGVALVQYPSGDSTTSKSTAAEHDASDNILGKNENFKLVFRFKKNLKFYFQKKLENYSNCKLKIFFYSNIDVFKLKIFIKKFNFRRF